MALCLINSCFLYSQSIFWGLEEEVVFWKYAVSWWSAVVSGIKSWFGIYKDPKVNDMVGYIHAEKMKTQRPAHSLCKHRSSRG
ncbi:hypothetical protein C0J52_07762 [Blattella germanica]|nr:hypothetical protein C0J52_07762 [Blattella germanica]